jgi:hypothetical protein
MKFNLSQLSRTYQAETQMKSHDFKLGTLLGVGPLLRLVSSAPVI